MGQRRPPQGLLSGLLNQLYIHIIDERAIVAVLWGERWKLGVAGMGGGRVLTEQRVRGCVESPGVTTVWRLVLHSRV